MSYVWGLRHSALFHVAAPWNESKTINVSEATYNALANETIMRLEIGLQLE